MGWLDRLRGPKYRPVTRVDDLGRGRVELRGVARAEDGAVRDPVSGADCVAVEYKAWPPSTTVGIDGGTSFNARAYEVTARQSVNFLLRLGEHDVLVRVPPGSDDVARVHASLIDRFGVGLRTETNTVPDGVVVRVEGKVVQGAANRGSPHRADPWVATVVAERFWRGSDG